ncbi:hypothetical protein P4O66_005327 [Electrophorus voltai]|uniref:Uncharacterized protein n=1 Tax=Electrophorus voltai TaxID=2609070 RepID=A0AAD8ZWU8_9TELE|nr:hypothetical protein P4O66_005327 [Electrophorus voltai]
MEQRAASPVSSCVCVKRNNSMMEPHNSSSGGGTSDPQRGSERAANPAPSCVCMKSDQSKDDPPVFSSGPVTSVLRLEFCGLIEEGCAALASTLRSNPASHL